jgi:hypothetical protein
MSFYDESGDRFCGRFLLPEEIEPWLQAQSKPDWDVKCVCTHHCWVPTWEQWKGAGTLNGIFDFYHSEYGWAVGKGPHFWVAPKYSGGPGGVWIGTHPAWLGIGAIGWNDDTLHIEYAWNGDVISFTDPVLRIGAKLVGAINRWIGVPLEPVDFTDDGWAVKGSRGQLFHRDTPRADKTCPGTKNTHDLVFGKYKEYNMPEQDVWTPEALFLKQKGIVAGFPDGTFRPNDPITRGQMAIALKRFYELMEKEFAKK